MPDRIRSPMPAITLWQPWASLIAVGAKPFEFRRWPAPRQYRGKRIAIHAGARPIRRAEVIDLIWQLRYGEPGRTALLPDVAIPLLESAMTSPGSIWRSAVVCTAVLGVPVRNSEMYAAFVERGVPVNDSDRAEHTNWAWPLTDIKPLEPPVPARGSQGFWMWTRAIERYGVASVEQMFRGFEALPPPQRSDWRDVLGFRPDEQPTREDIQCRRRELAALHHPDAGGNGQRMAEINAAADAAMGKIGNG